MAAVARRRADDEAPDPCMLDFVEVLAEALVRDYQREIAVAEKKQAQRSESSVTSASSIVRGLEK